MNLPFSKRWNLYRHQIQALGHASMFLVMVFSGCAVVEAVDARQQVDQARKKGMTAEQERHIAVMKQLHDEAVLMKLLEGTTVPTSAGFEVKCVSKDVMK